jgi:hypothetical protein
METPFGSSGFKPEEAYAAAAGRFFELLKGFASGGGAPGGQTGDWSGAAGPLAAQFEQWLRMSQSGGAWFNAPGSAAAMGGLMGSPGWSFGPVPLGPAAAQQPELQRVWELLARLTQLQTQLAAHWGEVARTAARSFVARAGTPAVPSTVDQTLRLYELWVSCAEEAYATTARRDDFSRLQSELANVAAALLVEQRRHAESLVRAFGLPTRSEVDALYAHIKDMTRRLAQLEEGQPSRGSARASRAPRKAGKPKKVDRAGLSARKRRRVT